MSLIKCSECGKEISNKAKVCPNCGAPIKEQDISNQQISWGKAIGIIIGIFFIILGLFLTFDGLNKMSNNNKNNDYETYTVTILKD